MKFSIVILAGGQAKRLGIDKALISLKDKPLIVHTVEKVYSKSEDILIVTKSEKRAKNIEQVLRDPVKVLLDEKPAFDTPLVGALSGFKEAVYENILLLGCDMPLINPEVIDFLFNYYTGIASSYNALIPQYPNGYIEPLCAIYKKKPAIKALIQCLEVKSFKLSSFINSLFAIHYLPINEIEKIDPDLSTFFNVNTRDDLVKLLKILEEREIQ